MSATDEYEREFSPRVLLVIGIVVVLLTGLLVGGGVAYVLWWSPGGSEPAGDGCARYGSVDLTVAPEMYDVVVDAVDDVAPPCTSVEASVRSGAEVALGVSTGGSLPDVWIPESRIWLGRARLGDEARVRLLAPSLARTPVLLVGGPRGGGTGLYDTALAAYREAVRSHRRNYSNAVVLMTDGRNEDAGSISLDQLLTRLRGLRDPDRPVRIVGIAISEDADLAALERMAQVTGGNAYLAAQPEDILGVFAQAVLSR